MDKCRSCGAELLSLARFCGMCGKVVQPNEANELSNIQTALSNPPKENTPPFVPAIHPLPRQNRVISQYEQVGPRPNINSSTEQLNSLLGCPSPQPPTFHSDYQQPLSPPYDNYQTPLPPILSPYGNYQQPQSLGIRTTQIVTNPGILGSQRKPPFLNKGLIIAIVAVVILASAGGLGLIFLKFQSLTPTLNVTSEYHDNGKFAGSGRSTTDGTIFSVTGQMFAINSAITFLLDNTMINKDTQMVKSDGNGNFLVNLKVTSDWLIGQHTLTARDASNNKTDTGVPLIICEQGDCGTPGPYGAPTNTEAFTITVHPSSVDIDSPETLTINSHGQSVCALRDDGRLQSFSGNVGDIPADWVITYACSGTYKGGKITYTETLNTGIITSRDYDASISCQLNSPISPYIEITGYYKDSKFSGQIKRSTIASNRYTCSNEDVLLQPVPGGETTWTGSKTS